MIALDFGILLTGHTEMPIGRPKAELALSEAEHSRQISMACSRLLSAAIVMRARIALASVEGDASNKLFAGIQPIKVTGGKWRRRFLEARIDALHEEPRLARTRAIDDQRVAELINTTLHSNPAKGATY